MEDIEVKFIPCNCGHERVDHIIRFRDHPIPIMDDSWLGYCKHQWDGTCPCEAYAPMDNLKYVEHVADNK